jgi:hypothetical protein
MAVMVRAALEDALSAERLGATFTEPARRQGLVVDGGDRSVRFVGEFCRPTEKSQNRHNGTG